VQNKELLFSVELHEASVGNTYGSDKLRVGHVIVMKNITPFIEKDQAKTHLIATVSHELKTPVASIRLSLKLLEDIRVGNLNPEQKELLASIHSDTDRLSRIIAELLNMAQVESGKLQLDVQPCDPRSLIAYALNAVTLQAEQRNIRIRQEIPEHLPQVSADREKTAWVLINLLINAIRYSPENSVIRLESQLSAKEWRLSVRDEGKGIQKEHRDRIFDKYFQVPGQPPGSGTGLGLAIAREFMEAQGGRIGVQSEENKGSTFYITLPLQV
jgi:signal transduction histidine kinase